MGVLIIPVPEPGTTQLSGNHSANHGLSPEPDLGRGPQSQQQSGREKEGQERRVLWETVVRDQTKIHLVC